MKNKLLSILGFSILALAFTGCNSSGNVENFITFHLADQHGTDGINKSKISMPQSGFEVVAADGFFLSQGQISNVQVAEIIMPGGSQKITGLLFSFTDQGSKTLYLETAANRNSWILMREKHSPVGLRKIDTIINNGQLFMLVEFPPETDLHEKAAEYVEGARIIQKESEKRKNSSFGLW